MWRKKANRKRNDKLNWKKKRKYKRVGEEVEIGDEEEEGDTSEGSGKKQKRKERRNSEHNKTKKKNRSWRRSPVHSVSHRFIIKNTSVSAASGQKIKESFLHRSRSFYHPVNHSSSTTRGFTNFILSLKEKLTSSCFYCFCWLGATRAHGWRV